MITTDNYFGNSRIHFTSIDTKINDLMLANYKKEQDFEFDGKKFEFDFMTWSSEPDSLSIHYTVDDRYVYRLSDRWSKIKNNIGAVKFRDYACNSYWTLNKSNSENLCGGVSDLNAINTAIELTNARKKAKKINVDKLSIKDSESVLDQYRHKQKDRIYKAEQLIFSKSQETLLRKLKRRAKTENKTFVRVVKINKKSFLCSDGNTYKSVCIKDNGIYQDFYCGAFLLSNQLDLKSFDIKDAKMYVNQPLMLKNYTGYFNGCCYGHSYTRTTQLELPTFLRV